MWVDSDLRPDFLDLGQGETRVPIVWCSGKLFRSQSPLKDQAHFPVGVTSLQGTCSWVTYLGDGSFSDTGGNYPEGILWFGSK